LEPTTESKFCITYGQKLDPTDSIAEPLKKKNWFILHGWSYRRRRTCCQFTLTHKSQSTNNQKLDVEIQTNRKKTKIIHVETNTSHFTSSSVRGVQPYRLFFTPISLTWSVSCYFALNGSALILHTAIVVNAVWTRVLLQLFFPQCALCPIFLPFLDMFQVHVIHGLGMLQVLGGMRHATRPLAHATCHVTWPFGTMSTQNMGGYECKTWQFEKKKKNQGKRADWEKIAAVLFVLTALTSMGICKVRAESVSRTAPSKKQWVLPSHLSIPHSFLCQTWKLQNLCDMGFWDICRRGGMNASKVCENASISVQVCSCAAAWEEKGS